MTASQKRLTVVHEALHVRRSAITADAGEDMAALTLDARGMVSHCNHAAGVLFKYPPSELVWRHVSLLLPQLANVDLVKDGEPNPRLRFLSRIGRPFQAVARDGKCFAGELYLNVLDATGRGRLSLIVRPVKDEVGSELQPAEGN